MLLFNPMTGLTHLGLFTAPTGSTTAALDLLETQRASLYTISACCTNLELMSLTDMQGLEVVIEIRYF